jgi:hypothetical protein
MANKSPNTTGILNYAYEKHTKAKGRVDKAIKEMIKEKKLINFNSVSETAVVSKAFLYRDLSIRKRIENLRHQQEGLREAKNLKRNTSDASKDVLIEALKNKIDNLNRKVNSLEVENQHLKDQIKKNLGKVYEDL